MSEVVIILAETKRMCILQCHWRLAKKLLQSEEHPKLPHKHIQLDAGYVFVDKKEHIFLNNQTGFKQKI